MRQFECDVSYIRRWLPYIPSITGYSPSLPDRSHTVVRRLLPDTMNHSAQSDREIYSSVVNPIGEILLFLISLIRARPARFTLETMISITIVFVQVESSKSHEFLLTIECRERGRVFAILRYGTIINNIENYFPRDFWKRHTHTGRRSFS